MFCTQRLYTALIGFGTIGIPISDKLYRRYREYFALIANGERRLRLESQSLYINGQPFEPKILSEDAKDVPQIDLLIICVKNYDLQSSLSDYKDLISDQTILLPLQNGIYAREFFAEHFPKNIVLQGYVQGPNTEKQGAHLFYRNPGAIHIGSKNRTQFEAAKTVFEFLRSADIEICLEDDIQKMVWKKWMLNVAGNSVTALTGADYSHFKKCAHLRQICTDVMNEFLKVANAEGIDLHKKDIDDTINYYVSYCGNKKTSMLMDMLNERKSENDFLAGKVIDLASSHGIQTPIIQALYHLLAAKEQIYLEKGEETHA